MSVRINSKCVVRTCDLNPVTLNDAGRSLLNASIMCPSSSSS